MDRRLYLPEDWAANADRREATHAPEEVTFQEAWRIAADLPRRNAGLPHAWVVGDDEFGRPSGFRQWLRKQGERYLLAVPCNTTIRDLERRRPRGVGPAWVASVRSRSVGSTPGRHRSRPHAGPGSPPATGRRDRWSPRR